MAYTESKNLGLKIQDDDEFNSILVTAENFWKIDNSYGEMLKSIDEAATDSAKKFQAVNTALGEKAASRHKHTADDITETAKKKFLTAVERTKLGGIATGATKNIVDGALNKDSTNPVENGAIARALAEKAESGHTHTAAEIAETADKKILTAAERTKLEGIANGATRNIVDQSIDENSTNAVSNKVFSTIFSMLNERVGNNSKLIELIGTYLSKQDDFVDNDGTSGRLHIGEFLLQWGFVKKTNSVAETVEAVSVTFNQNYRYKADNSYFAIATAISSVPQKISLGITNRKTTGFTINHYRTNTQETHIVWLTVGRGAKDAINETETDMALTGS